MCIFCVVAEDDLAERAEPGGGSADSAAGSRAQSLHWILEKARSPEVQDRIREYVRDRHDATDPVWRDLIQDADVFLYGGPEGSITLLPRGANPALDKDVSALGDEAFRVLTSAGEVEVMVSFAQDILSSPASTKALEQMSGRLRKTGVTRLSPGVLLIMVVMWLIAVGLPAVETALPPRDQSLITNELATIGLALAITDLISKRKKG